MACVRIKDELEEWTRMLVRTCYRRGQESERGKRSKLTTEKGWYGFTAEYFFLHDNNSDFSKFLPKKFCSPPFQSGSPFLI
jgi:hypothetical protein